MQHFLSFRPGKSTGFSKKHFKPISSAICPACGMDVDDIKYVFRSQTAGPESLFYLCQGCTLIFARPVFIAELTKRHMDGIGDVCDIDNSFHDSQCTLIGS